MAKIVHWTPTFAKRRAHKSSRIFICINGEGYGHSSRALAVARHLDPESVIFGTYGYVKKRIDRAGYRTVEVGPEVKFFGEDGKFELSKTILKNASAPLTMGKQFREELKIMKDFKITCVLSDCRAASVFAAAKLGIPCLYMTNQTEFEHFFHRRKAKKGQDLPLAETAKGIQDAILGGAAEPPVDFAVRAMFKEISEIIVADFPPPHTVCLPMLSRKPQVMKLQRMVGPVTSWTADEVLSHGRPASGPYVVGTLGGHAYRLPLFNSIVEAAALMPDVHFDIFSSFTPEQNPPPNLRVIEFTENPERYYKAADLVVSQAGHSTAMELLTLGKPSLLVPDYKQIEQESNAQRMVELGVSTQMSYPDLTARSLAERIRHHLQTPSYEVSAYQLARLANEMNGARRVAALVNEYGNRVHAY